MIIIQRIVEFILAQRRVFAARPLGRSRRRRARPPENRPGHVPFGSRPRPVTGAARSLGPKNRVSFTGYPVHSAEPSRACEPVRSASHFEKVPSVHLREKRPAFATAVFSRMNNELLFLFYTLYQPACQLIMPSFEGSMKNEHARRKRRASDDTSSILGTCVHTTVAAA